MPQPFDVEHARATFPALALRDDGMPRTYLDAPGGTQVAQPVIDAMTHAMVHACANDSGAFRTSRAVEALSASAHTAAATFLGADAEEVIYGASTTAIFFQFARMISRLWQEGDNILLTRMEHDANAGPWLLAAERRGVEVRWLEFDTETFDYRYEQLETLIDARTRFVACNHASNLLGTINDVARIVRAARTVGALTAVDAVQAAPHVAIDVRAIGCDLLACSPYKFFGPHAAIAYVSPRLQSAVEPIKVRPCASTMPDCFEHGTPSFEAQAGTEAAIRYIASLGDVTGNELAGSKRPPGDPALRASVEAGLRAAQEYEIDLMRRLVDHLDAVPGVTVYGTTSSNRLADRVPTFTFRLTGHTPAAVAEALARRNIFAWHGSYYAYEVAGALGIRDNGGAVRIGLAHYNTVEEVDRFGAALAEISLAGGRVAV